MPLTAAEIDKYDTPGMASVQFWLKQIAYHLAKVAEQYQYVNLVVKEEDGGIQVHE